MTAHIEVPLHRVAFRPAEVAASLGINRATVYRLMASGEIPFVQLGGVRLVRVSALEAVLAAMEENTGAQSA